MQDPEYGNENANMPEQGSDFTAKNFCKISSIHICNVVGFTMVGMWWLPF